MTGPEHYREAERLLGALAGQDSAAWRDAAATTTAIPGEHGLMRGE